MLALRGPRKKRLLPCHPRPCSQEALGQEEARAAPLPDVVNHRSLKDTEEPVLLGVLWPFLHFSPGGRGWRERGKQVSWLQNDVLIILPETKGRRGRTVTGCYGKPLFLDNSSCVGTSHGVRGHQLAVSWGGARGTGRLAASRSEKKEQDKEKKDVAALLRSPTAPVRKPRRRPGSFRMKPWDAPTVAYGRNHSISREGEKPRATLIPLKEANDSWPGLRAMMSPSTNRLTGRLTRCPSL